MKNNMAQTTGMTLVEVIVAGMLVSVVLVGLYSIGSVFSTNSQDYGQRFLLASQTQATLNRILNDASLAVSDNMTSQDPGIFIDPTGFLTNDSLKNTQTFCIHQTSGANPGSSSDTWRCYSLYNSSAGANAYQIFTCTMPFVPGSTPWGTKSCGTVAVANYAFVGTAYSWNLSPTTYTSHVSTTFPLSIQNCLNDTATSCFNSTSSLQDPVNNPQVTKTGSVATLQSGT